MCDTCPAGSGTSSEPSDPKHEGRQVKHKFVLEHKFVVEHKFVLKHKLVVEHKFVVVEHKFVVVEHKFVGSSGIRHPPRRLAAWGQAWAPQSLSCGK